MTVSPSGPIGAVPETAMREPRRTARENPIRLSYADADRNRSLAAVAFFLLT
jgi:hypothetical protein